MIQRYFTTSSNCLFCLTVLFVRSLVAEINIVGLTIIFSTWHHQIASSVSLKPEDIQLTVTKDKEKQQICTFERKSASCRLIFCRYSTLQVYFLLTLTGTLWNAAVSNKTVTSLWASILGLQLTISGSVDYFPQTIDQCRKTIKKKLKKNGVLKCPHVFSTTQIYSVYWEGKKPETIHIQENGNHKI